MTFVKGALGASTEAGKPIVHSLWHVRNEILAVICINLITLSHGCAIGWMSPALLILTGSDSPLDDGRPISTEMVSWLGAINNFGGIAGNFFYSWVTKRFGRKVAFCLLAIPNIAWWLSLFFVRDSVSLLPLRVVVGLSGGGALICVPLFIAEIASDHVRGSLGSCLSIMLNLGILIAFVTGSFLPYHIVPGVLIVFPVLFLIASLLLPETPQYLITHNRPEDAEKSLRFYKGCSGNSAEDQQRFTAELARLHDYRNIKEMQSNEPVSWSDFTTPEAIRGMGIGFSMMALNIFSGCLLMLNYAGTIFRESGSDLDPSISSIVLISVQVCGTYMATFLIDRMGRRAMLIISSCGTAFGTCVMATYNFLSVISPDLDLTAFNWVPVASLSLAMFSSSLGLFPLVFVVVAEVLPLKIRERGSTYCLAMISLLLLVIAKLYPIVAEAVGMYSCFWFFSVVCVSGLFFAIYVLPETNGKNINSSKS